MAFEDDVEGEDTNDEGQGGTQVASSAGYTSSRGAANPYTGQLQTLLTKYMQQSEKSATDKQALLDEARQRLMDRSIGPDSAEMAFRLAAALGKPTRTGGFGETLANVAEATTTGLAERRKANQELEDLNLKYKLAASDVQGEKYKTQVGALSALARSVPRDRLTEVEKLQEVIDDPASNKKAKENAQARITYLTTRPGKTNEIDQLVSKLNDPNLSDDDKKVYKARINYLTTRAGADKTSEIDQLVAKLNDPKLSDDDKKVYKARVAYLTSHGGKGNELDDLVAKLNDPNLSDDDKKVYKARVAYLTSHGGTGSEIDQLLAKINDPTTSEDDKKTYKARIQYLTVHPTKPAAAKKTLELDDLVARLNDPEVSDADKTIYRDRIKYLTTHAGGQAKVTEIDDLVARLNDPNASEDDKKVYKARIAYLTTHASGQTNEIDQLLSKINDPNVSKADKQVYRERLKKLNYIAPEEKAKTDAGKPLSGAGKIAKDEGLTPGTPEYIARVKQLTGEGKGMTLSATEQKEMFEADDIVKSGKTVILNLTKAKSLNDKAYSGMGAGLRRTIGRNIPGVGDSEGVTATTELESLVGQNALDQLKGIFGGAPTEGERKILLDLQGSINMGPKERAAVWDRAIAAAARRVQLNEDKMKKLKSGAYSRMEPEEKADGGPVGHYADGGMVHMADGGDYSMANFGRAMGQGLGLGFGDEAIARVRAKMEGRPYDQVVAEEREAYQQFQEKHPYAALGTELVSGLIPTVAMSMVPGAGTAGAIANAPRMAATAQKFMAALPKFMTGSMGRAAGTGAATGAISGAGSATEGNRAEGALEGGATGMVLGPTVAKGLQLVGSGAKAIKNAVSPSVGAVQRRANEKVLQAMGRDEMDTQALRDRMMADKKLGVKSTIMDATPSLSTLGEAVVTRPGQGRKILGQELNDRLESGRESAAGRALKDVGKGVDYTAQEDTLMGKLRANANNLYDKAYAYGSVDDTRLQKVLEDDTFKKAFKEAQAIAGKEARAAELRGEDASRFKLNDIYDTDDAGNLISVGKIPDVRTLDYIKRGIDALIDKGYRGEGMGKAEANALKDLKKAYVQVIDENVPEYAAARKKYAGDMEVLDALRMGRTDYLSPKMLPAEAKKTVDAMSDAERDALRAGVAQSLLTKVLDAPQQVNAAQRIIGAPATRKRLEALFQDPNEYKLFEAAMQRESELFRNAQDVVRGSRTANKTEALKDLKAGNGIFDIAGEAMDVATGSPGSVVGRVLKYLQARTTLDEKTAGEVAKMLKSGSTQEVDDVLNRLEAGSKKIIEDENKSSRRMKTVSGAVGATLPTTPRPVPVPEEAPEGEDDEAKVQRIIRSINNE
jgi:hypothetical protein